jgi:hypothetical protein
MKWLESIKNWFVGFFVREDEDDKEQVRNLKDVYREQVRSERERAELIEARLNKAIDTLLEQVGPHLHALAESLSNFEETRKAIEVELYPPSDVKRCSKGSGTSGFCTGGCSDWTEGRLLYRPQSGKRSEEKE